MYALLCKRKKIFFLVYLAVCFVRHNYFHYIIFMQIIFTILPHGTSSLFISALLFN